MITIQELLYNRGLSKESRVKLVRHKDARGDIYEAYKRNPEWFLAYQSTQSKPRFKNCDYIVSFIGEKGVTARFVGVYRITGHHGERKFEGDPLTSGDFIYEMEEVEGFEDLKERVIINWNNPISWHQWIKNEMEVIEIQPGLHYRQFTDYFDFILNFDELKEIVENQYPDWKRMLSATNGIYLISDTSSGKLYVGSAYGADGVWGRWSNYVRTNGHGGNKALRKLLDSDPSYGDNFEFSILMLLPKTVTPDEAIKKEQLFKKKLGTNSFGLNLN